jgi:predicted metal-binding membrane protein
MFPLDMMKLAVLATVTVVVFEEKTLPQARLLAQAIALILTVAGALMIAALGALSTFMVE